jgi:hypothetical protein
MSTPNLDSRYAKPSDVATAISDQATIDAGQYASVHVTLTTGLSFTVSALDIDGWSFAGGTETLPGYGTWYVGVDLYTKQIRTLPRDLHRGWVKLAKFVATPANITDSTFYTPLLSVSRLPRLTKKILDGEAIKVVVMGSSLTQSDGSNNNWPGMLFGAGNVNEYRFPAAGINATYTGVGGSPNSYQLAQTAMLVRGMGGSYSDGSIVDRSMMYRGRSQLLKDVDLVVLGCLANGGEQRLGIIEATVRNLRKAGIEVILTSDNPQGPSVDYTAMTQAALYGDGVIVSNVADRYGVEFADTAAYVAEAYIRQNGANVYAAGDTIHQNATPPLGRTSATVNGGHELWARAIRSTLTINGTQVTGELFPEGTFDSGSTWVAYGSGGGVAVLNYAISGGAITLTGSGATTDYGFIG